MALMLHDEPTRGALILSWVRRTFHFYDFGSHEDRSQHDIIELLSTVFSDYELPATIFQNGDSRLLAIWQAKPVEANAYLQRTLLLSPSEPFPFLKLPPELRNTIYNMVLDLPVSGVEPQRGNTAQPSSFRCLTRDICTPLQPEAWYHVPRRYFWHPPRAESIEGSDQPCQRHLSLLLANKQIYEEARPLLYSRNLFCFRSMSALNAWLCSLPIARRQHITRISLQFEPCSTMRDQALRMLATLPSLRKLQVHCIRGHWPSLASFDSLNAPGLRLLGKIKGSDQLVFRGDPCPNMTAHLKPQMESPRTQKGKKKNVNSAKVWARQSSSRAAKSKGMRSIHRYYGV